jgi:hypothetical protein
MSVLPFNEPAPTRVLEISKDDWNHHQSARFALEQHILKQLTHEDVSLALIHVKSLESTDDEYSFTAGADDLIREEPKVAAYALYLLHLNPHNKRKWHLLQLALQQRDPAKWKAIAKAMPNYT